MRVLVAYENRYRFYREVLARTITYHRPHLQVRHDELEELGKGLVLFDPHTLVSSQPECLGTSDTLAWVELPAEPSSAARIRLGGKHEEASNLSLAEVMSVLDRVEELLLGDEPSRIG